jgi:DNA invertase Pin-like site-specific DNA recombinase
VKVAGYVRVSSRAQGTSGLGLAAQKAALTSAAAAHDGWELVHLATEIASAGNTRKRPVLRLLLDEMDAGRYEILMCARLDRLARSVGDFASMMDRARAHGWKLVMLDPGVDMTTPYGEAMAGVAAVFAQLERALISQRTKEGLAIARERGTFVPGRHLQYQQPAVLARIMRWHETGSSYGEIVRRLDDEGIPTVRDGRWTATTVRRIIHREKGNTR